MEKGELVPIGKNASEDDVLNKVKTFKILTMLSGKNILKLFSTQ